MNARTFVGGMIASGVILGVGAGVGTAAHQLTVSSVSTGGSATGTAAGNGSSGASSSGASSSGVDGTYTGASASTRFGDVQVQVTVSGGRITDVTALHLTDADGRSVQISNRAAPILRDEVLSAQSANVQMVSGATYTSEAYLTSLQSALDQAGM